MQAGFHTRQTTKMNTTIEKLEDEMKDFAYLSLDNPFDGKWETQTIEFFTGLSLSVSDSYEGYFLVSLSLSGFCVSKSIRFQSCGSLILDNYLSDLSHNLREAIAEDAAECVRVEIKSILRI